ncbi:MAG: ribbon-helix-helix protein, CopG family [Parcubacteria group bacterium]|nr:ribbon-helix-helix protein, CopG family [Parcubacteria group bacterium]
MATTITVTLPKKEKERLERLALRYGLSLTEFSRRLLEEISSQIPEESFRDYKNPKELRASFERAIRDWRAGRVRTKL